MSIGNTRDPIRDAVHSEQSRTDCLVGGTGGDKLLRVASLADVVQGGAQPDHLGVHCQCRPVPLETFQQVTGDVMHQPQMHDQPG